MKNRLKNPLLLIALLALCTSTGTTYFKKAVHQQETVQKFNVVNSAHSQSDKTGKLLFFLNPNGRPCQIQASILNNNKKEIEKHFEIKYLKTTDSSSRFMFYKYGIRTLPSIILLNADGKVYKRFPPGIQSKSQLIDALKK